MASSRTRAKTEHPLFGHPADLPASQLPTIGDALKLILKYKSEDEDGNIRFENKNMAIKEAALNVLVLSNAEAPCSSHHRNRRLL